MRRAADILDRLHRFARYQICPDGGDDNKRRENVYDRPVYRVERAFRGIGIDKSAHPDRGIGRIAAYEFNFENRSVRICGQLNAQRADLVSGQTRVLERDINRLLAVYPVLELGAFADGVAELGHCGIRLIFDYLPGKGVDFVFVFVEIETGVVIIIFVPVRLECSDLAVLEILAVYQRGRGLAVDISAARVKDIAVDLVDEKSKIVLDFENAVLVFYFVNVALDSAYQLILQARIGNLRACYQYSSDAEGAHNGDEQRYPHRYPQLERGAAASGSCFFI